MKTDKKIEEIVNIIVEHCNRNAYKNMDTEYFKKKRYEEIKEFFNKILFDFQNYIEKNKAKEKYNIDLEENNEI